MINLLLNRLADDPWWLLGSAIMMLLLLGIFLFSLIRNFRFLAWFYGGSILVAFLYGFVTAFFPMLLSQLVAYRADWSLLYLAKTLTLSAFLSHFLFYILLYASLAIILTALLGLWSLITFRFHRFKILLLRSLTDPWYVLLFTASSVLFNIVWTVTFGAIDVMVLGAFFELLSFLFLLQLLLRFLDNAYLSTPQLFLEFTFSSGFLFLLFHFLFNWYGLALEEQPFARILFFDQLFSFFLAVLLMGYLSLIFIRDLFASAFFLERNRQMSFLFSWTSRFLFVIGITFSLLMGFFLILLVLQGWYLALIPTFFLSFFILFYLLDRQDDMRVRGDLVDQRIQSSTSS